jgi:VNT family MFS transporter (synaptic vesicle glycoprotein 2)
MTNKEKLQVMLNSSKSQVKALTSKPYAKRLCVTGSIMFCMTSTYYSLMTWFPELFQRFAAFEKAFPGKFASVCTVSQHFGDTNNSIVVSLISNVAASFSKLMKIVIHPSTRALKINII